VRFDVVSGDFRFITSAPGLPEVLETRALVATDETGKAQVRFRVLPGARNQIALLQVTDLVTGAYRRASFAIAQFTGDARVFFAIPDTVRFIGPSENVCASGSSTVTVFGGVPPYTGSSTSVAFQITPTAIENQFNIFATGVCAPDPGHRLAIADSAGRVLSITAINEPGTAPTPKPTFVVAPDSVTLTDCTGTASFTAAGGSGTYSASSDDSRVVATVSGSTISVKRTTGVVPPPPATTVVNIRISDGVSILARTVNISSSGTCP
jgi:hypothetical protein